MDAGIRAVNWLVIKELFETNYSFNDHFLTVFFGSIYEHGCFIRSHLKRTGKISNNHYLSGIASLFFIALYCPFFKKSKSWLKFAFDELQSEIDRQVYPDG